jgi:hypothetical protein
VDTPYFLTGSIRVRKCPETEAILARLREYRDADFDVSIAAVDGGEVELTIDGCRDLVDRGLQRLEDQLQALGPYARGAAIFQRHHDLDVCGVIVAPSREAGLVALSRVNLEECRYLIRAMIPEDRAALAGELRAPLTSNESPGHARHR